MGCAEIITNKSAFKTTISTITTKLKIKMDRKSWKILKRPIKTNINPLQ